MHTRDFEDDPDTLTRTFVSADLVETSKLPFGRETPIPTVPADVTKFI